MPSQPPTEFNADKNSPGITAFGNGDVAAIKATSGRDGVAIEANGGVYEGVGIQAYAIGEGIAIIGSVSGIGQGGDTGVGVQGTADEGGLGVQGSSVGFRQDREGNYQFGTGVLGAADEGGIGVWGRSTGPNDELTDIDFPRIGVRGDSDSVMGTGVYGEASYTGVDGHSSQGTGVRGISDHGVGVLGQGDRLGVYAITNSAEGI